MLHALVERRSMPSGTGPGRPPKFDEPLITRRFALPSSLNDKVVAVAKQNVWDDVEVVREALRSYFGAETQSKADSSATDLRAALKEVVREELGGVVLSLNADERELLTLRAKEMGYSNPAQMVEDLVKMSVGRPIEEVQEYMGIPQMFRRAINAVTGKKNPKVA